MGYALSSLSLYLITKAFSGRHAKYSLVDLFREYPSNRVHSPVCSIASLPSPVSCLQLNEHKQKYSSSINTVYRKQCVPLYLALYLKMTQRCTVKNSDCSTQVIPPSSQFTPSTGYQIALVNPDEQITVRHLLLHHTLNMLRTRSIGLRSIIHIRDKITRLRPPRSKCNIHAKCFTLSYFRTRGRQERCCAFFSLFLKNTAWRRMGIDRCSGIRNGLKNEWNEEVLFAVRCEAMSELTSINYRAQFFRGAHRRRRSFAIGPLQARMYVMIWAVNLPVASVNAATCPFRGPAPWKCADSVPFLALRTFTSKCCCIYFYLESFFYQELVVGAVASRVSFHSRRSE